MPPKSNAERQKAYRERLKNEKPDKYEEIRLKHLKKVKENIKKKKENLTEEDKQELLAKWRQANSKRAEIKKKAKTTTQDNTLEVRSKGKTNAKLIKDKLHTLTEENTQLKKRNKNLRQTCNRMKRRMDILKIQLHEQTKRYKDAISIGTAKTSHCDDSRHEQEELKTDIINSMPVLFFEDLLGEEVLITDDKDIFDALPFDNQEFNLNNIYNKDRDVIVKNNNAIENKPEHDYINNKNTMQIEDNHKTEDKTRGLTILKEEKLENIHTKNKVIYRKLKPLSLNSYINVPKQTETKSEKLTMKPKISRKDFNYYFKDNEEIYKALMDSD